MKAKYLDEFGRPVRYFKKMPPSMRGEFGKAARGATSGGNKKHSKRWHRSQRNQAAKGVVTKRGRMKQLKFIDRAIILSSKRVGMNPITSAIKSILGR